MLFISPSNKSLNFLKPSLSSLGCKLVASPIKNCLPSVLAAFIASNLSITLSILIILIMLQLQKYLALSN